MWRALIRFVILGIARIWYRVRVRGAEHFPRHGGVLVLFPEGKITTTARCAMEDLRVEEPAPRQFGFQAWINGYRAVFSRAGSASVWSRTTTVPPEPPPLIRPPRMPLDGPRERSEATMRSVSEAPRPMAE